MAQYLVPKFIEEKPKIVGPLTFRQFIYVGGAGLISAILYFTVPLLQFILVTMVLLGGAIALAFITIGGRSLPAVLWNSLSFLISTKVFLWKRKKAIPKIIHKKEKPEKKPPTKPSTLKMIEKSRLKETETKVKTWKR